MPFLHSYLVLYPFMWDRPILDSHTLQVYKPLFFFQSTYLTGEPQWELFLYYTLFINVFSTFLFSKGSRWKKRGLVLLPASLLLTLLWEPIQISVPACLHNVHSNYVHRHYLMSHLSQSEDSWLIWLYHKVDFCHHR